jgi:hypothetical protein
MYACEMCSSPRVSVAVAIISRVTYKITRNLNKLLKCVSEPLSATKHASNFLRSH